MKNTTSAFNHLFLILAAAIPSAIYGLTVLVNRLLDRQIRRKNYKLIPPPGCRVNCNLWHAIRHHYVLRMMCYCRKWGWKYFWKDTLLIPDKPKYGRGEVFGPEAQIWKFCPERFIMHDGRSLKEWESER